MRVRYQRGSIRLTNRKSGTPCWEFLWRENDVNGKRAPYGRDRNSGPVSNEIRSYSLRPHTWRIQVGLRSSLPRGYVFPQSRPEAVLSVRRNP